jgi:EpsI family protein
MSRNARRIVAATVLLATANVAFYGLRASLAARAAAPELFPDLPDNVGKWSGATAEVDEDIYAYLAPDKLSCKAYQYGGHVVEAGAVVSRDWRSVHSPAMCYSSGGWTIVKQQQRDIPLPKGVGAGLAELPVQELLVNQENQYRLSLYTFLTPGNATGSWLQQCFRMAVSGRGRGGVLLLLSANVSESPEQTQELLRELVVELYVTFEREWKPDQHSSSRERTQTLDHVSHD